MKIEFVTYNDRGEEVKRTEGLSLAEIETEVARVLSGVRHVVVWPGTDGRARREPATAAQAEALSRYLLANAWEWQGAQEQVWPKWFADKLTRPKRASKGARNC